MDLAERAEKLARWTKEKVLAAGCRGVVIGLSGGIDSSVLAALCHRAFPDNTLGLIMPCHSDPRDKEHALLVAEKFNIPAREVALDGIYDTLLAAFPRYETDASARRMAEANVKVRLRMLTSYYVANQLRYIIAGSSDKSELTIGYFTKYGDGGVDIMPLGNLLKTEVQEMARVLDVPQPVIAKPPSPGLWEGQTAEGELGLSYKELDRYLITGEASNTNKERIEYLISVSAHKRALPPIPRF